MVEETYLLQVSKLNISIKKKKKRPLRAVRGVSFAIKPGQRVCLVGESGCGKTLTAFSILRLLSEETFNISGTILFKGINLLEQPERIMRSYRGNQIGMIFQEPMTSLNPVMKIGLQITEAMLTHLSISKEKARERAISLLAQVGIKDPTVVFQQYPHELSGGLRQRAMIAMALSCNPSLLIADEPTTALDVTIQAQILDLLTKLSDELGLGLLFISHNLGVVAQIAQKIMVMYAGKLVEVAPVKNLFSNPIHPYTKGLLASIPYGKNLKEKRLSSIKGHVPSIESLPPGCPFEKRCNYSTVVCKQKEPELKEIAQDTFVACHLF